MTELDTFRDATRSWLESNCPAEMRLPLQDEHDAVWGGRHPTFKNDAQKVWLERMAEKGWTAPEWPARYGGGGLSKQEGRILKEEMNAIRARPPLMSFGLWMLGPALLKYGSEEQKAEHLPRIVRGEIRWAQGYSEPNSGSDLASLATRCEANGDHYLINGQKIWTSYGHKADWIFVLVRTDFEAAKHDGISLVLVDMDQAGVTTRPIKLLSGMSHFCETFFDDARCEMHNLVGEINQGWTVAKYLLTHEREMIGGSAIGRAAMRPLSEIVAQQVGLDERGLLDDPVLRVDVARAEIDSLAFLWTTERIAAQAKAGQGVGALSSMLKYYGTELNKRRYDLMMYSAGHSALAVDGEENLGRDWLRSKANSIEGGTSEVQLNIVAKRILGLPSA
ncbi:MAG: acyl-CoA dehydrogenase family protein [Arenicellales bacterium]|mgnify:FL=1|nr:acyl-CoA dehydrogenase family protein [Arenicellales bacterium]MDP6391589.1 acyl-CoA dehydrogenase family protein [Arenicellales bacterium]MDP7218431.1 acyl-CoA dehydrogenase family protein [Arenicellales bacterium]HJP10267.1 acyl-CoA dehydrogenase family protein [Arenicellales bacterium]